MNKDLLIDLADDALDRLDRVQRWWAGQSPHPALTQVLLTIVVFSATVGSYANTDGIERVSIGIAFCLLTGWVFGLLGCVRSLASLRPQPEPSTEDDATADIDPEAVNARRRLRLWSACFWWLQLPWMLVVAVRALMVGIALVGGSPTSKVGLGCTQVPIWAISLPVGLWIWQRHFRRMSRSLGSRTEEDLDGRVWWFGAATAGICFVWAGLLII